MELRKVEKKDQVVVNSNAMFQIGEAVARSQMFFKIGVLKIFANFKGKHLCWSPFLIKLHGWKGLQLYWKETPHRCFLVKFAKFLRTHFSTEHLRWLLLKSKKFFNFMRFSLWLCSFLFDTRGFSNNPNFILFNWRLKRKYSPWKCSNIYFAKKNKW